jgi:GNAT superfamily N-acetyltransferase
MIAVHSMASHPEWIAAAAVWWHRQWGEAMGYSPEGAVEAIAALTAPGSGQTALIGLVDGQPAGSVFLIESDLDTHPHLTPWLAGLFVLPEFRRHGLGDRLLAALTTEAGALGYDRLYLYTATVDFYCRRGWHTVETLSLNGVPHDIMSISTAAPPARS